MDLREVLSAIHYLPKSGCPWRMLPCDFAQLMAVQRYFWAQHGGGLLCAINHLLAMTAREQAGREANRSCFAAWPVLSVLI